MAAKSGMSNLSVTVRIAGGYVIVLLLAAAILGAGLFGIAKINAGLEKVTQQAMPMNIYTGEIANSLLQAQIELARFQATSSSKKLDSIESSYQRLKSQNAAAVTELTMITASNDELHNVLQAALDEQQKTFADGDAAMAEHRKSVKSAGKVSEQKAEFGDMGDEILSYSIDLEGQAEGALTRQGISTLTEQLDDASTLTMRALNESIPAAVLGAASNLKSNFAQMDKALAGFATEPGIAGSKQLKNLQTSYANFKQASAAVLAAYADQLKQSRNVAKLLKNVDETGQTAIDFLNEFTDSVADVTDEIESSASASVANSKTTIIGFAAAAILASILISLYVIQSIRKPLNQTIDTIATLATGDLRSNFRVDRKDELGKLAQGMQNLVDQLRSTLQQIHSNSEQLAATAEQSAATSRQSLENVSHQKSQAEQIATATEEMTQTVAEVARSISNTLEQVEGAHSEVNEGVALLDKNIANITDLAEDIERGSEVIESLNDNTKTIGSVLDVIKDIAEQTNLLALNAAIEAARAGEQGRGFAVVADEVRTLASRTNDSTVEIQQMIEKLQVGAKDAVDTMSKSREAAQNSVEGISRVGEMLGTVSGSISSIKDMSHQIASASEEQSCTTQEQHRNVVEMSTVADEAEFGAKETQAASDELAKMADALRGLVNQFKL